AEGINPLVDPNNLPARPPNSLKRKKKDINPKLALTITNNPENPNLRINSTTKRRKYTIHDLEETSEEKDSSNNETKVPSNSGKSPSLFDNIAGSKNLVKPFITSEKLKLGLVESSNMTTHYEEDMTITAIITKLS
ncbi:hypothetical protein A2U01_0016635, partial [Trifolium medium]|nr:hypothetical protein [Trifolium medium]